MNIVDRRPNPKGKSLSNRQRFLARARVEVKSAVQDALRKRKVADVEHGEKVSIPTRGITEPMFHHSRRTGKNDIVVPGNKEYVRGDEIPRPQGGGEGGGREGSPDGEGDDAFEFTLSKESSSTVLRRSGTAGSGEEKPQGYPAIDLHRAGYTVSGSPSNLSIPRTMRNGTRHALHRPKLSEVDARARSSRRRRKTAPASARSPNSRRSSSAVRGAPRSSPTSTRSTCAIAATSGCRKPTPKR